ncbi:histidine kinase [Knoellia flava TL1]|uniref:Sensor-like histidine kinase SenX3 n=2 Tax=Knoellia flava TaxID=913969 RepID=A0A8H9FTT5_9MICO|nr:ATP-binding protein [Knoellia flava]KGN35754.1 histidine kinase [Knoellia flava TL1]GGB81080.1 two-component sensor histidine kinase [Knoellia flava]
MDATLAGIVGGALGLVIGAVAVAASRFSERTLTTIPPTPPPSLPSGVTDVLAVLRSIAIVLDASDAVVNSSASAVSYGLVRHGELVHAELRQLARQVRRDGEIREVDLELSRGFGTTTNALMKARVAPLGASHVLILAEDHTHARRVEEVRRDFVANVSHELKTPVGGIALLAEAVLDARDDPEAVSRFAARIQVESTRLTRLVKEIVDLSRLQVADTLHEPELVSIPAVVAEAVDRVRVAAESRQISLETVADERASVFGDAELLATAIANLVSNAVNYSEPGTRVAVAARRVGDTVEVTVSDQGQGIPASEQGRIFERFYRVDAARSRATGGTGLGLAIVKHVCATHGGDVSVWSEEGRGSTFTMRLPAAAVRTTADSDRPAVGTAPGTTPRTAGRAPTAPGTAQGDQHR